MKGTKPRATGFDPAFEELLTRLMGTRAERERRANEARAIEVEQDDKAWKEIGVLGHYSQYCSFLMKRLERWAKEDRERKEAEDRLEKTGRKW